MKKTELSDASLYIAGGVTILLSSIVLLIIFFNGFLKNNEKTEYVDAYKVNISIINRKKYGTVYQPTYYYEVNGTNYKYTPIASTFLNLEDIMANRLYYNPTDPTDVMAIYETKISAEQWLSLFYFVMFFVCSIILIFIGTNQAISLKCLQKKRIVDKRLTM